MKRKEVLPVELSEVAWNLIDPSIEQGKLPTFARLKREGTWGAPMSVDSPPQMDLRNALTLLGLPVPSEMKGRVLREAFSE